MSDMEMLSPEEQEEASRDDRDRYHAWGKPPAKAAPEKVQIKHDDRWTFNVEKSHVHGDVWFSIYSGAMSGGSFLPSSVARELGEALIAHADWSEEP
jgi:hypothetical protein